MREYARRHDDQVSTFGELLDLTKQRTIKRVGPREIEPWQANEYAIGAEDGGRTPALQVEAMELGSPLLELRRGS